MPQRREISSVPTGSAAPSRVLARRSASLRHHSTALESATGGRTSCPPLGEAGGTPALLSPPPTAPIRSPKICVSSGVSGGRNKMDRPAAACAFNCRAMAIVRFWNRRLPHNQRRIVPRNLRRAPGSEDRGHIFPGGSAAAESAALIGPDCASSSETITERKRRGFIEDKVENVVRRERIRWQFHPPPAALHGLINRDGVGLHE